MEKVLLIGKTGTELKQLSEYLQNFFRTMSCTETTQNAGVMLRVAEPNIVVTLLNGVYDVDMSIFEMICQEYPNMPVLTVGGTGEFTNFSSYYKSSTFENLLPPLTHEDVLLAICRRLNLPVPEHQVSNGRLSDDRPLILVVDDDAMTLRSIKSMLDEEYRVNIANSGMKAMTSIGKEKPNLILLDYEMPVCDGKQTLEMIRADDDMTDIPVIFLTGVSDRAHVEAVLKLKPAGYLLKPAVRETLIDSIEKVLRNKG